MAVTPIAEDLLRRIVAVIPIRSIEGSKSRLGGPLDAEEREALVGGLLSRTIRASLEAPSIAAVVVVSPDPAALQLAAAEGAVTLNQANTGLNEALRTAEVWADEMAATALLVLPADLPNVGPAELEGFLAGIRREIDRGAPGGPGVVGLVSDRHREGTNLLLMAPPGLIEFAFGPGSRSAHEAAAQRIGARFIELEGPLSVDLDTPDDLLLVDVEQISHEGRPLVGDRPAPSPSGLEILPLDGIPEVVAGDDLPALLAAAVAATPGVLPLRESDVLLVTQKIVSKAEGAVVDLTTIEPRPEAVAFAARWDRDPRQVEVVLREARRIIRMANGVIIVETKHGFICANGGIDASNVGPASGSIVTLLPEDSDASAGRIRAAVRDRFGVDVPVIVSDSFGRPWRWGIVDVAIGVSGLMPLEDLRGQPDADGRIMKSTIRAVADEIASAAELVLGKAAGRPCGHRAGRQSPAWRGLDPGRPDAARIRPVPVSASRPA